MDYVSAYASAAASGELTELNREPCGGTNPVHLAVDGTNRFLIVSNYTSGSVAVMGIRSDGSLSPVTDLVEMTGSPGPHRSQQASAHPHHNPFDPDGRFIVVPDKGLDKIFVFGLDAENGKLVAGEEASVTTREGAGPRHVDFHPRLPYLYAINELDSTITTYRFDRAGGELTPLQILSTLPSDYTGNNTGAGNLGAPVRALRLWVQQGTRQHRNLPGGSEQRLAPDSGMAVHSGKHASFFRFRSLR